MSATLARKLRRIGLERIPNTEVVETTDEQGNTTQATRTTYSTLRRYMSPQEKEGAEVAIIKQWRERRKRNKSAKHERRA